MLRQLAPWVLIMMISTILSNVFHLCTQFFNFWYISTWFSLYSIIYNSNTGNKKDKIKLINNNYDINYIMQYSLIFFLIMFFTFIFSYFLNIDFFVAYTFVYLGEIINYSPLEIKN